MSLNQVLEDIKDEIRMYKADGDLAMSGHRDPECEECGENVFNSILNIIDKYKAHPGKENCEMCGKFLHGANNKLNLSICDDCHDKMQFFSGSENAKIKMSERLAAEKDRLDAEGDLFYSKSQIAVFDLCISMVKGELNGEDRAKGIVLEK